MSYYIKKVVINAIQWTGNKEEIKQFFPKHFETEEMYFRNNELFYQYLNYEDSRCVEKIELNNYIWYDLRIEFLNEEYFNRRYKLYLD